MAKILRVFPKRTQATPDDDMVRIGFPDLFPPECDEIHISVTFTYDTEKAKRMAEAWGKVAPVKLGGPALNDPGSDFIPGQYLKKGYVITSRGCPNKCWFCMASKREGGIRELPITEGWNVLDNNLLACSREHIASVFKMLSRQPKKAIFSGGLEPARMEPWIAERLAGLRPSRIYLSYDDRGRRDTLVHAVGMLRAVDYKWGHSLSAYILIGYQQDTFSAAEERLNFVLSLGVFPFAMLYRDEVGRLPSLEWRKFQREWVRPRIIGFKLKAIAEIEGRKA
jgi:hypothetical protein